MALCRCGVGGGKHLFKDCPKSKEKAAKKAKKEALAAAPPIPGLLPSDAMAAISALLSQIVVNGGAVAGTGVESKSDSAYTFLRHRAPTPSRSTSVPPGDDEFGSRSTRRFVPVALVQNAVSAPVSPHNAARSPLFRLIAPSTVDLPYRGQWLPPLDGATERVLLASDKLTAAELRGARTSTDLVIIGAVDSGCTGSLTPHHRALINVRPCDEKFSSADGTVTSATCIGDMPVTIRDHLGHPHTVVFRNVRCVPDFHYTLLSVTQLWQEQRIEARFADSRSLQTPPS